MSPGCSEEQYRSENGKCCKRCKAGTYKLKDCDESTETHCDDCRHGFFTATVNHMDKCWKCKTCNRYNHQITVRVCTAREDTVCGCEAGFYCGGADCGHCYPVSICPEGHGVKTLATRKIDTICSPCETGTFSHVLDSVSACKPHTRCDDIGRELKTEGTATTDAVCGNFKTSCDWMLPGGLWIGLVLTSIVVFSVALFCWKSRRCRPRQRVSLSQPEAPVEVVPDVEVELKIPLPPMELHELYRDEPYKPSYSCDLESDGLVIGCDAPDPEDGGGAPITPLSASVSFAQTQILNANSRHNTGNYHRTISEPQEDEWCGT